MKVIEIGPMYFHGRFESDIKSVNDSKDGLFVVVDTLNETGNSINLNVFFEISMAYRYLDESDLEYYWDTGLFSSRYHVYQILEGGWSNGEVATKKVMGFTYAKKHNEYFIATSNGCMHIVSEMAPIIKAVNV